MVKLTMSYQISCHIYAHDLLNPPSLSSGCDVDLILRNSQKQIQLVKEETSFQTRYLLTVYNPSALGLISYSQEVVEAFIDNLVLSMNLNLKHAVLSIIKGEIPKPDVKLQPESQVIVKETLKGKIIEVTEIIFIQDSVYITMKFAEEIDEGSVLSIFTLINKLYGEQVADKLKANNLKKALADYKSAMKVFDRVMIFKELFNSLEKAVNWDGVDRKGEALDKEVSAITGIQQSKVKEWRTLYNRIKHIDREPKEVDEFISGIMNLHSFLKPLRIATNEIIINRLKRTVNA